MPAAIKDDPASLLRRLIDAGLDAADPLQVVPPELKTLPKAGRTLVLGAGKAAAKMAQAVELAWPEDAGKLEGLVVTRYGHGLPLERIEVVEAAHPVPDAKGEAAARRMLEMAESLGEGDQLLALISGGGSSLLSLPAAGLTLEDKQAVNKALLRSGADITQTNCLRKHLSAVKGGRLASAAYPAATLALVISDVPGDDPAVIASGPTVPDPTTFAQARAILDHFSIDAPEAVRRHLEAEAEESPKPGDERLSRSTLRMIARPQHSLEAMAEAARRAGVAPMILSDRIEGESREVARVMAAIALQVHDKNQPLAAPAVLLSGGETTVTIRGDNGRGGPNQEFLLALAIALEGHAAVHAIACDSDGVDGSEEVAGAVIGPDTLQRARARGLDPKAYLAANDAYGFFDALGDLVITGPTLTNVNDLRAVLILPRAEAV